MIPAFVGVMSTRLGGVFRVDINFSLQQKSDYDIHLRFICILPIMEYLSE